ncbi:MAG: trehalose-6-phosphate synthase, partial [Candidatus Omnitrophota bacterium]
HFKKSDWEIYKAVNQKFANVVLKEIGDQKAFVFIQDYHFALLPTMLKKKNPNCIIAQFWHIPWPNREVLRVCPWQNELLNGLLGNDLLGFHIMYHCHNFLDTVERNLVSRVDTEKFEVIKGGRSTLVRSFPISVDFKRINERAQTSIVEEEMERLRKQLGLKGQKVILGADRIDYTKGIPERLQAMDLFFEKYPQYIGKVTFVQVGVLSRIHLPKYKALNDELNKLIEEINFKYQQGSWKPICFNRANYAKDALYALYRLADICLVSSLHDGMNLVAKEFVAARPDKDGVLILSYFTGAARELHKAIMVNPYSIDDMADAIKRSLEMSPQKRKMRMSMLRQTVKQNNIYRWAGKILSELLRFEFRE